MFIIRLYLYIIELKNGSSCLFLTQRQKYGDLNMCNSSKDKIITCPIKYAKVI